MRPIAVWNRFIQGAHMRLQLRLRSQRAGTRRDSASLWSGAALGVVAVSAPTLNARLSLGGLSALSGLTLGYIGAVAASVVAAVVFAIGLSRLRGPGLAAWLLPLLGAALLAALESPQAPLMGVGVMVAQASLLVALACALSLLTVARPSYVLLAVFTLATAAVGAALPVLAPLFVAFLPVFTAISRRHRDVRWRASVWQGVALAGVFTLGAAVLRSHADFQWNSAAAVEALGMMGRMGGIGPVAGAVALPGVVVGVCYLAFFAGALLAARTARGRVGRGLVSLAGALGLLAVATLPLAGALGGPLSVLAARPIYTTLATLCLLTALWWGLTRRSGAQAPSWQVETALRPAVSVSRAGASEPAGAALIARQYGRWLFGGGFRWLYRRWTRVAVRLFPEGSRSAAIATRLGIPLPDRLNMSWITPQLAVGGRVRPKDIPLLAASGVTMVVDTRSEEQDDEAALGAARIGLLYLPTPDTFPVSLEQLEYGGRWIRSRIDAGERVLVHCEHGVGRSVMMTAASLMVAGSSTHEALTLIERRRWQAAPNRRQVKRLREFEAALAARRAPAPVTSAGREASR